MVCAVVMDIEVVSFVPDAATGDATEVVFAQVEGDGELVARWSCETGLLHDQETDEVLTDHRLYAAWTLRLQYEADMVDMSLRRLQNQE